jgi:hypothetical protein
MEGVGGGPGVVLFRPVSEISEAGSQICQKNLCLVDMEYRNKRTLLITMLVSKATTAGLVTGLPVTKAPVGF